MSTQREPLREPLHQPPNPDDLRRVPPATPDCAKVRGWLRDFVDNDLDERRSQELQEHVHRCRVCAIELARCEHEVQRLRAAFARSAGRTAGLPEDFAARVVDRLVMDETSLVSRDQLDQAVSAAETRAESARATSAAARTASVRSGLDAAGRGAGLRPAVVLLGAIACLCLIVVVAALFGGGSAGLEGVSRLVLVSTKGVHGQDQWLVVGNGVAPGQFLRVDEGGTAHLHYHDATTKPQPAASMRVHGQSEVHLRPDGPLVTNGDVDIQTNRQISIPMADGSRVDFGVGEYSVSAQLNLGNGQDPLTATPPDLLIEVEVKSGQPAMIVRPGLASTQVLSGWLGIYHGSSETVLESTKSGGGVANDPAPEPRSLVVPPTSQGYLMGHAREWSGGPSVGSSIWLRCSLGGVIQDLGCLPNADGNFHLPLNGTIGNDFVIAMGLAPELRRELGMVAPDAVPLVVQGNNRVLASSMGFELSTPVYGQVRDVTGVPLAGVQVVPCIVDDLFGLMVPLPLLRVVSNEFGTFLCERLPARLPPQQSLRLLCLHEGLAPAMAPVPVRGSVLAASLQVITLRSLQVTQIIGLQHNRAVEILEELPGLPLASGVLRRAAVTDSQGMISSIAIGSSRMWLRYAGESNVSQLSLLSLGQVAGVQLLRPATLLQNMPQGTMFRPLESIPGTGVEVVSTFRHRMFAPTTVPPGMPTQAVDVVDSLGRGVAAQVFLVSNDGPQDTANIRFLGFSSVAGRIQSPILAANQGIVAMTGDGRCGMLDGTTAANGGFTIQIMECGRALLPATLRPTTGAMVALQFRRDDASLPGLWPTSVRFVGTANAWEARDLLPGHYQVKIGNDENNTEHAITVPSNGFVVIH